MNRSLDITGYTTRPLSSADSDAVQALLERCADFFALLYGHPPGPAEAQSLFLARPAGKDDADKMVSGIFDAAANLVGVLDVIRDYPEAGVWYIGLLLLEPTHRNQGVGAATYRAFAAQAGAAGARRIQLAVAAANVAAFRFWQRMGFDVTAQHPPEQMGHKTHILTVMQKWLAAP